MATPKAPTAHKYTSWEVEDYESIGLNLFSESDYERAIEIMKDVASFGPGETIDFQKLIEMAKLPIDLSKKKHKKLLDEFLGDIVSWSMEEYKGVILPVVIIDRNTGLPASKVIEWIDSIRERVKLEDFLENEHKVLFGIFEGTR